MRFDGRLPLSRALWACVARRLASRGRGPALAAAAAGCVLVPGAAYVLGAWLAPRFAQLAAVEEAAVALAATLSLVGVTAGLGIGALAPGAAFLGSQLQAAPLGRGRVFLELTLAPFSAVAVAAGALASAFLVPLTRPTAAGAAGAAVVLAAVLASVATGAAAASALRALARRQPLAVAAAAPAVLAWAAGTAVAGHGPLAGPAGLAADALTGRRQVPEALAALLAAGVAAALSWAAVSVRAAPEAPAGAVRAVVPLGGRTAIAVLLCSCKRLFRRRELRLHVASVLLLAGGGALAVEHALGLPPVSALVLAALVGLLGAALLPLASGGIEREAEWLWRVAPRRRGSLAAASAAGALALGAVVVAAAVTPALVLAGPSANLVLGLLAAAGVVLGAATLAAAVVPWRRDRLPDQLVSYVAFGVAAAGAWLAAGRAARALEAAGAAPRAAAGVAIAFVLGLALAATAGAAERRAR